MQCISLSTHQFQDQILKLELGALRKKKNEDGISAVPDVSNHSIIRMIFARPI